VLESPLLVANPRHIYVGDRVLIRRGVRLEAVVAHGRSPEIRIGEGCNIEQNVHIVSHSRVTIGRRVSITANCAIVDVTHPYDGDPTLPIGSQITDEDSFVEIGDGCFIGIGSIILPNVQLGPRCVVGAHSVVSQSFGAGSVVAGVPARLLKRIL
jgi:acetyltransferase-like isoleucine patch superfamily enzyme